MESSLKKILTPTSSLDLLREIDAVTSPSTLSLQKRRPYVISIVGVNGVGKSTNLSKICFFLLQNKYKVLIVACDTFRSGAVEQLAVHVRNLKELSAREGGEVELYQKGYGKDAANVAKDSVTFAAQEGFDVVLIDTAGRRHNDQRLMSSLEKFAKFAQPDKILMVGEVSLIIPMGGNLLISFRLWLVRTLSLKHGTSTQHLAPVDRWMVSSFQNAILLETWLALWSAWSMLRMFLSFSLALDSITAI
jgi:signal recognition particle GTPase